MRIGTTRIDRGFQAVIGGTVALAVFVAAFYIPASARSDDLDRQLVDLEKRGADLADEVAAAQMPPQALRARMRDLERQKTVLDLEQDVSESIKRLSAVTRHLDVDVVQMRPIPVARVARAASKRPRGEPDKADPIVRHEITIGLRAGYRQLFEYLKAVERLPGSSHVSQLALTGRPDADSPGLDAELRFCVYAFRETEGQGAPKP